MDECRHIRINGTKCNSAALRGQAWCYFHDEVYRAHADQCAQDRRKKRKRSAKSTALALRDPLATPIRNDYSYSPAVPAQAQPPEAPGHLFEPLQLPLIEDISSIQLAISRTLHALAANTIDPKRAGLLLYGLQIAAQHQPKHLSAWHTVSDVGQTDDGIDVALAPPGKATDESFQQMARRLRLNVRLLNDLAR